MKNQKIDQTFKDSMSRFPGGGSVQIQLAKFRHRFKSLNKAKERFVFAGVMTENKKLRLIAAVHEYGSRTVPARPYIRPLKRSPELAKEIQRQLTDLTGEIADDWAAKQASGRDAPPMSEKKIDERLKELGQTAARFCINRILSFIPPPLKIATIESKERKGYATPEIPLSARGDLINAIGYQLAEAPPQMIMPKGAGAKPKKAKAAKKRKGPDLTRLGKDVYRLLGRQSARSHSAGKAAFFRKARELGR